MTREDVEREATLDERVELLIEAVMNDHFDMNWLARHRIAADLRAILSQRAVLVEALEKIKSGEVEVYDEDLRGPVLVPMAGDEAANIARLALSLTEGEPK